MFLLPSVRKISHINELPLPNSIPCFSHFFLLLNWESKFNKHVHTFLKRQSTLEVLTTHKVTTTFLTLRRMLWQRYVLAGYEPCSLNYLAQCLGHLNIMRRSCAIRNKVTNHMPSFYLQPETITWQKPLACEIC